MIEMQVIRDWLWIWELMAVKGIWWRKVVGLVCVSIPIRQAYCASSLVRILERCVLGIRLTRSRIASRLGQAWLRRPQTRACSNSSVLAVGTIIGAVSIRDEVVSWMAVGEIAAKLLAGYSTDAPGGG